MRPRPAGDVKLHGIGASEIRAIALRRGGTRRAALRAVYRVYGSGKGGNAATLREGGFYRSHDRRHARFRRPTSPVLGRGWAGKWWTEGRHEGTILRHDDVASHHLFSPEIARHETPRRRLAQLAFSPRSDSVYLFGAERRCE